MKKRIGNALFLFVLMAALAIPVRGYTQATIYDLQAIDNLSGMLSGEIRGSVRSDSHGGDFPSFTPDDSVVLDFTFVAPEAFGEGRREYYIVAVAATTAYLRTPSGWQLWDGDVDHLRPACQGDAVDEVTFSFSTGPGIATGEYAVYAGFRIADGALIYGRKPLTFIISNPDAPARLHRIEQAAYLEDYLKNGISYGKSSPLALPFLREMDTMLDVSTAANGGDAAAPVEFSSTNIQEQGVDEADRLKTDGSIVYRTMPCVHDTSKACIASDRLIEQPATSEPLSMLELETRDAGNLYLLTEREESRPDLLVHVAGGSPDYRIMWDYCGWWQEGKTIIHLLDISTPANINVARTMEIDGILIGSRRIGEKLYLVTRNTPTIPGYYSRSAMNVADDDQVGQQNLAAASLEELLPTVRIDQGEAQPLVDPQNCIVPILPPDVAPRPTVTTLTVVPLYAPEAFHSLAVVGESETLYMSSRAVYLATSSRRDWIQPFGGVREGVILPQESYTELHKFSLTGDDIEYRGSGQIPGTLGYETDKKSFRMGEYDGVLRIATSVGNSWDATSSTTVSLLREHGDSQHLETVGALENLGERGETLYAARFVGKRGFLVTFKVTDPLYVLNLEDPEHPEKVGELHIDGYSDYLHPLGDNLLLGLGKDAIPDEDSSDFSGRGAWYQGVKLSLYDITPGRAPAEIESIILGKRGTDSAALSDHHAFTWLARGDGDTAQIAIPVELADVEPQSEWFDPSEPNAYYGWNRTGLWFFEVNMGSTPGLEEVDSFITNRYTVAGSATWQERSTQGDRSIIQGDTVHYLHNDEIYSFDHHQSRTP
ncbi:MAG: beta-propeller domain-containing protein [Thermodesulfobacteriota bacterium]|nr:beta-propeller domain-containing protein [Thermodesulfobacteriota bacterium]